MPYRHRLSPFVRQNNTIDEFMHQRVSRYQIRRLWNPDLSYHKRILAILIAHPALDTKHERLKLRFRCLRDYAYLQQLELLTRSYEKRWVGYLTLSGELRSFISVKNPKQVLLYRPTMCFPWIYLYHFYKWCTPLGGTVTLIICFQLFMR